MTHNMKLLQYSDLKRMMYYCAIAMLRYETKINVLPCIINGTFSCMYTLFHEIYTEKPVKDSHLVIDRCREVAALQR